MNKFEYKITKLYDYYGIPAINISLEETNIEDDDPLLERANDIRTPFEQYDAGETYIYVDLSDLFENYKPAIYSRDAYHNKFLFNRPLPYYTYKNYKFDFDDYVRRCAEIDEQARDEFVKSLEQLDEHDTHFIDDWSDGIPNLGFVMKADYMGGKP